MILARPWAAVPVGVCAPAVLDVLGDVHEQVDHFLDDLLEVVVNSVEECLFGSGHGSVSLSERDSMGVVSPITTS